MSGNGKRGKALVIGGGISGITAALVYAEHTGRSQDVGQVKQPAYRSGEFEREGKA